MEQSIFLYSNISQKHQGDLVKYGACCRSLGLNVWHYGPEIWTFNKFPTWFQDKPDLRNLSGKCKTGSYFKSDYRRGRVAGDGGNVLKVHYLLVSSSWLPEEKTELWSFCIF